VENEIRFGADAVLAGFPAVKIVPEDHFVKIIL
jgi:hypothetical protein